MMRRKLSTQEILIAFLGAVVLAGMIFFIYSQIDTLKSVRSQIDQEQLAVNSAISNIQKMMLLKEQAPEMEKKLAVINQCIPLQANEEALISEFNRLANHYGIQLVQLNFEPQVAKQGYVEIPLIIIVEGRYFNLVSLLTEMQSGSRTLRIDEFKMGPGQQGLPYLKTEIKVSAFYQTGSGNK